VQGGEGKREVTPQIFAPFFVKMSPDSPCILTTIVRIVVADDVAY
jgi:hypothetical protein